MRPSLLLVRRLACLPALALLGVAAGGCNGILGIDEPVLQGEGGAGGTTGGGAGTGGGGTAGMGGSTETTSTTETGSTTTTTTPCDAASEELLAVEDAALTDNAAYCNGSIATGKDAFSNIGTAHGVFRFALSPAVEQAFAAGAVTGLQISLARAPTCGGTNPCTVKVPGLFEARPMRSDWSQGNGATYSGPDWCRRSTGNPGPQWDKHGASGPLDAPAEPGGMVDVVDADLFLVIDLDPAQAKPWVGPGPDDKTSLSVRVNPAVSGPKFVASMSEYGTLSAVPRLTVTYCP